MLFQNNASSSKGIMLDCLKLTMSLFAQTQCMWKVDILLLTASALSDQVFSMQVTYFTSASKLVCFEIWLKSGCKIAIHVSQY